MRISQLEGRRVALWGWGREGRAAYRALRDRESGIGNREPGKARVPAPLTLFCDAEEAGEAQALGDAALTVETEAGSARLAAFDVVIKSPGISPYQEAARSAGQRGTVFIGGSTLWFDEHAGADGFAANTICITGTKGKSTTTALLAHLLRAGGHRTALAGNIGLPLLEVLDPQPAPAFWAIELSSYQTLDVAAAATRPHVAVVLNLFPEHLDWHGSEARYISDKLALVTQAKPAIAVLNAADPRLAVLQLPDSEVHWFNHAEGWHLRGDAVYRGEAFVFDSTRTPLPGRHNRGNLCAVLATLEALGLDAVALAAHAETFRPLPNRLQTLGTREGITYVNDSHQHYAARQPGRAGVFPRPSRSRSCWAGTIAAWTGRTSPKPCSANRRASSSPWARTGRGSTDCSRRWPRAATSCWKRQAIWRWRWRRRAGCLEEQA